MLNKDLEYGEYDSDVLILQRFLNSSGFTIAWWGDGSRGKETSYFGAKTRAALAKFQVRNGLSGSGRLGPLTRKIINNMTEITPSQRLLNLALSKRGTDFTDDQIVSDEVSCAFAVSTILHEDDDSFPIKIGTAELEDHIIMSTKFKKIAEPHAGCIVICATGTNSRPDIMPHGHTGIYISDVDIMSNDSNSGLWLHNYTRETWRKRYYYKGGYPIHLYEKVS